MVGGPTQVGLESMMSPSTLLRVRKIWEPLGISLVRSPRRNCRRVATLFVRPSGSISFCSLELRPLVHSKGVPPPPLSFQVRSTRLAGVSDEPLLQLVVGGVPVVSAQEASQLIVG